MSILLCILSSYASKFSQCVRNYNPHSLEGIRGLTLRDSWVGRTWVHCHRFFHKGPKYLTTLRLIQFSLAVIHLSSLSSLELINWILFPTSPNLRQFLPTSPTVKDSQILIWFLLTSFWLQLCEFNYLSCPNLLLDYFSLRIWSLWQGNMTLEHSYFRQNVMVAKSI